VTTSAGLAYLEVRAALAAAARNHGGIVHVQHRPDRQADWFVLSPVQAQFDLRAFRNGPDLKAREGCTPQFGFDLESFAQVGSDDAVHCLRNAGFGAGLSEKADIGGQTFKKPWAWYEHPDQGRITQRSAWPHPCLDGNLIAVNGDNGNAVEVTPTGRQVATVTLVPHGAGDLFGVTPLADGQGLLFVNDGANALDLFSA
jgi:hypothetical protein